MCQKKQKKTSLPFKLFQFTYKNYNIQPQQLHAHTFSYSFRYYD